MVSDADKMFVDDLRQRFPRVDTGYRRFGEMAPKERIPSAFPVLGTQLRTGWLLRFDYLPDNPRNVLEDEPRQIGEEARKSYIFSDAEVGAETVLEHSKEAQELFSLVFHHTVPFNHEQWGVECLKFHDFHEAVDGDFTPHCNITKPEKKRLEAISIDMLCEARHEGDLLAQHIYNCWQLFDGKVDSVAEIRQEMLDRIQTARENGEVTPQQEAVVGFLHQLYFQTPLDFDVQTFAKQTGDIDALHMAVRSCRMVKDNHIKPEDRPKMDDFWDYIEKKLQTNEAKTFFEALKKAYQNEEVSYKGALTMSAQAVRSSGIGNSI